MVFFISVTFVLVVGELLVDLEQFVLEFLFLCLMDVVHLITSVLRVIFDLFSWFKSVLPRSDDLLDLF